MIHMELVTDLQAIIRRDFPLADRTLANPLGTDPLLDGEFLSLNDAYQLVRGADQSLAFAAFAERGRFDVQALGKVTVLFCAPYEADTRIFASANLALGDMLMVKAGLTVDTTTPHTGLGHWTGGPVIGYVTRMPANNGGKLRFLKTLG